MLHMAMRHKLNQRVDAYHVLEHSDPIPAVPCIVFMRQIEQIGEEC